MQQSHCSTRVDRVSKQYDCKFCGEKYSNYILYYKHIRKHTRPKCPFCLISFTDEFNVKKHLKIKHSDKLSSGDSRSGTSKKKQYF